MAWIEKQSHVGSTAQLAVQKISPRRNKTQARGRRHCCVATLASASNLTKENIT